MAKLLAVTNNKIVQIDSESGEISDLSSESIEFIANLVITDSTKGIVYTSENGNRFKMKVDNNGVVSADPV